MLNVFKITLGKREFFSLACIAIIGTITILAGSMLETIGSREIADPIVVELSTVGGKSLDSTHVFFRLARSGTLGELTRTKTENHQWHYENIFIENLFLSVSEADLANTESVSISIGDKQMTFSESEIADEWREKDISAISHFLEADELGSVRLFQVPADIRSSTSHLPFLIFKRIINWGGDIEFFVAPTKNSMLPIGAFLFVLVAITIIIKRYDPSKTENFNSSEEMRGYLQIVYTVVSAVIIVIVLAILIAFIYKPDVTELYQVINETYIKNTIGSFAPEPLEQLLVVTLIPLSAPIIFFSYLFWRGLLRKITDRTLGGLYSITNTLVPAGIFALAYLGLALADFLYLSGNILSNSVGKYIFILVLFPVIFYFFYTRHQALETPDYYIRFTGNTLLAVSFLFIFTTSIQSTNAPIADFHFNPILYPISQLVTGKLLLIDVPSIYGLYPVFIAPLTKFFGFSSLSISAVFATLICISYFSLFLFMRKVISNTALIYSGMFAVLLYSYFANVIHLEDFPYYQYWPIRILFPTLFLVLLAKFLQNENRFYYIALLITAGLGVLWNIDSGIIVLISLIVVLSYHEFSKSNSIQLLARKISTHILIIIGTTVLSWVIFVIYTHNQSGLIPELSALIQYQKIFVSGYFLIPLPPPLHIWASIILVYLIGLTLSVRALLQEKITYLDKLITALSIMGLGLFIYYTGRSHDYSLFGPSFPALVLLAIYGDMLFSKIQKLRTLTLGDGLLFGFVLFILVAAPVSILLNIPMYAEEARSGASRIFASTPTKHSKNIDFIRNNTALGKPALILAQNADGLYYGESGVRSAIDSPSTTDLFMLKEVEVIINFLSDNTSVPVFISEPQSWLDNIDPRINPLIDQLYIAVQHSEAGLIMFIPR